MATFLKTIQKTIKHWYVPAIIGLFFVLFGVYILVTPLASYAALAFLFSLSFLVSGALEIWFSVDNRNEMEGWGWYLAGGILLFLIGVLLMAQPGMAEVTLALFVGFTLLFHSIQGLGFSFELRNYGIDEWWYLALVSALGVIISFILIFNPVITGVSLVVITALAFILSGTASIVLSFQLKKLKNVHGKVRRELKDKIDDIKEEFFKALRDDD